MGVVPIVNENDTVSVSVSPFYLHFYILVPVSSPSPLAI